MIVFYVFSSQLILIDWHTMMMINVIIDNDYFIVIKTFTINAIVEAVSLSFIYLR